MLDSYQTNFYIFASSCENLPNTLLEAMSFGFTIISSFIFSPNVLIMKSISSSPDSKLVARLSKFKSMILSRIFVSEAEVERVFSRHKSIHTKMRANLSNELVEKMLFVRYNAFAVGAVKKFEIPTEEEHLEVFEELDQGE